MKKYLLIFFLIIIASQKAFATEQQPDFITYQQWKSELRTHWAYPSPLEIFYIRTGVKSPFEMLHTANYRGHIASWLVENRKLYLTDVKISDFQVPLNLLFADKVSDGKVHASWFTGILLVKTKPFKEWRDSSNGQKKVSVIRFKEYVIFDFENGLIKNEYRLSQEDYWEARR